jgi:hypothetical protein
LEALRPEDKYVTTVTAGVGQTFAMSEYQLDKRLEFLAPPRAVMLVPTNVYAGKDLLIHDQASMAEVMAPNEFMKFQYALFNAYKDKPTLAPMDTGKTPIGVDTVKVFSRDGKVHNVDPTVKDSLPMELTIANLLFEEVAYNEDEAIYVDEVMLSHFGSIKK